MLRAARASTALVAYARELEMLAEMLNQPE
jgi:hypothetical protein